MQLSLSFHIGDILEWVGREAVERAVGQTQRPAPIVSQAHRLARLPPPPNQLVRHAELLLILPPLPL